MYVDEGPVRDSLSLTYDAVIELKCKRAHFAIF